MSQPRDRYEPDDELYQREASVHIERLDDNAFYVGVTGVDGTYYWMNFYSESPITWTLEKHEPVWCLPNAGVFEGPGCVKCGGEYRAKKAETDSTAAFFSLGIYICPDCGNKRCPKAAWHGYKCTGSNKPGQLGEPE